MITETAKKSPTRPEKHGNSWRVHDTASKIPETARKSPKQPENDRNSPELGGKKSSTSNITQNGSLSYQLGSLQPT